MSYLDVPRLHFAGKFIAKPSTVNNEPKNFSPKVKPPVPVSNRNWNPTGNHFWQFLNCKVQSAVTKDGAISQDPILQAAVISTDTPVPAKLVDLDSQQQGVSQIWGLQISVAISNSESFTGDFRVVCFNDINFTRSQTGQGDATASAYYQSFLDNVEWSSQISSPFLQELQSVSPARLSIKFVVDGYQQDSTAPNFNQGRIVGTIGPAWADEPPNFVLGRAMRPNANVNNNPLWFGYARVDELRQKVLVDLGNSVPTQSPGGSPPDLGTLQLAVGPSSARAVVLGDYDYSEAAYLATAGIQEFSVSKDQIAALRHTPLGVLKSGTPSSVLLQEGANGTYLNATEQVYRMNPSDVAAVELIALKFGVPASGQQISLQANSDAVYGPTPPAVGIPASGLTFSSTVTTGDDGRASFSLNANDPANPRKFIDGQLYGVAYSWALDADPNFPPDPNGFVNVLVFDSYQKAPDWKNIQPILQQYAKLYPFMDSIFQLDDPKVIQQHIAAFQQVLNIPLGDSRYMPVTRDMSRDKRQLILKWLMLGAPVAKTR
jgi:hypothetical protein